MDRPRRHSASLVTYISEHTDSELSVSEAPSSDVPISVESGDAGMASDRQISRSESGLSKPAEADEDSIVDMTLEDSSEGEDVRDSKQRSLKDFVVKMKSKEQQHTMPKITGKASARTCALKRKSYRELGSDSDLMTTEEKRLMGQATPWNSKASQLFRKIPRRSSYSSSTSSSVRDSESDCSTDNDVIELNRSGRPRRKTAQNALQREPTRKQPQRAQSLFRNLVSKSSIQSGMQDSLDKKSSVPLSSFSYQGSLRRSARTLDSSKPSDKHNGASKRRFRRIVITSSSDEGVCDDDIDDRISQQAVDTSASYSNESDQSEDSEDEETVSCDVSADEIDKILVSRKNEEGVKEILVKLKGKSYRQPIWFPFDLALQERPSLARGFLNKGGDGLTLEDAIHEDWTQVQRIIGRKCTNEGCVTYLVRWKGLTYSESTWETEESLKDDQEHISKYLKYSTPPKRGAKCRALTDTIPEFQNGRVLRDYQKESVEWMIHNQQRGINCILGDEMGLGKTAQSTAVLEYQRQFRGNQGPFLVIAPLTTLTHWQREIETWTDMYTVIYTGSKEERQEIIDNEFYFSKAGRKSRGEYKFNVLIASYDILLRASNVFSSIHWKTVIIDEAHRLKSTKSLMRDTIVNLRIDWLLLMTGTPIQNNLTELFSLMNLLNSERYPSVERFMERFGGNPPTVKQVQDLQGALRPLLLRRMKEDVETLPVKEEILLKCSMTQGQHKYYKALYSSNMEHLLKANLPGLSNLCMELRKVCNHPFLCKGYEEDVVTRHREVHNCAPDELDMLIQSSGKLYVLDQLLGKLKSEGHQVLIFSQFTMMLDVIEDYLRLKLYRYERIDGSTSLRDRELAIDRFTREDKDNFVFMLSTKAGGSGITLTAADTVIIYDSDWNPQNDLQAMARCHRIGQDREVMIYRMISWDTYEQSLFECASKKYGLEEAVLGKYDSSDPHTSSKKILDLLRNGAHSLASNENGGAFVAENIDQILKNRSEKRQIGSRAGNTFSEVTFTVQNSENRAYWESLLPNAVESVSNKTLSPMGKRRNKRRVNYSEAKKEIITEGHDTDDSEDFVPGAEVLDGASTDDDDDDVVADIAIEKKESPKAKWTYPQLAMILEGYSAFGSERWTEILKHRRDPGLQKKPAHEIAEAFDCLQEALRKAANLECTAKVTGDPYDPLGVAQDVTDFTQQIYECQIKNIYFEVGIPAYLKYGFESKGIMKALFTRAKQIHENVKGIEAVAKYVEATQTAHVSEVPIPYNRSLLQPNTKFNMQHDKVILKGVYKHGFSSWHASRYAAAILEDKELGLLDKLQQDAPSDDRQENGLDLSKDLHGDSHILDGSLSDPMSTMKKQIRAGQEVTMAKSALSRRIRKLLEGFGAPSTGTLVSKMNKLNVKPKPEEHIVVGTLLPKSPSKLLPMLKKKGESQSIQDKNSTENQNKRPTSSIFPFVQCASKEVKASDICLISDSDIEILSGSEDGPSKTEKDEKVAAKSECYLSNKQRIGSPSEDGQVQKSIAKRCKKVTFDDTEGISQSLSPTDASASRKDKTIHSSKRAKLLGHSAGDRKDQAKLTEFWMPKSLGWKSKKRKLGREEHAFENQVAEKTQGFFDGNPKEALCKPSDHS